MNTVTISVNLERTNNGAVVATSEDIKGLYVQAHEPEDIDAQVSSVLEAMFAAQGKRVQATKTDSDTNRQSWELSEI